MKFILLAYEPAEKFEERLAEPEKQKAYFGAWGAFHAALVEAGVFETGHALKASDTSTTLRVRHGERRVQDGPYADTKEQLGGYFILELPNLDAALEWAARCPAADYGAVELRPLQVMA